MHLNPRPHTEHKSRVGSPPPIFFLATIRGPVRHALLQLKEIASCQASPIVRASSERASARIHCGTALGMSGVPRSARPRPYELFGYARIAERETTRKDSPVWGRTYRDPDNHRGKTSIRRARTVCDAQTSPGSTIWTRLCETRRVAIEAARKRRARGQLDVEKIAPRFLKVRRFLPRRGDPRHAATISAKRKQFFKLRSMTRVS